MGRAINNENDIDTLKREMKELQDVVAELSEALMHNTQVHHVDLTEEVKPATKHKKAKPRKIEASL